MFILCAQLSSFQLVFVVISMFVVVSVSIFCADVCLANHGVVAAAGNETKFGKNKKSPPTKYTRTDMFINNISLCIFVFQLVLVLAFGIVGTLCII
jgi:magnesium-transporting ATPase (P-type)